MGRGARKAGVLAMAYRFGSLLQRSEGDYTQLRYSCSMSKFQGYGPWMHERFAAASSELCCSSA